MVFIILLIAISQVKPMLASKRDVSSLRPAQTPSTDREGIENREF